MILLLLPSLCLLHEVILPHLLKPLPWVQTKILSSGHHWHYWYQRLVGASSRADAGCGYFDRKSSAHHRCHRCRRRLYHLRFCHGHHRPKVENQTAAAAAAAAAAETKERKEKKVGSGKCAALQMPWTLRLTQGARSLLGPGLGKQRIPGGMPGKLLELLRPWGATN